MPTYDVGLVLPIKVTVEGILASDVEHAKTLARDIVYNDWAAQLDVEGVCADARQDDVLSANAYVEEVFDDTI